ncbi:class I SAM-dependent methyltransferase [Paludibaculum fermentans]|uniref:Methyltransferase domain-containing protein n=1 Tax=Paludibaculum fermentans TaxID=1473598 RepID=A0A7S7NNI7_PALFE|nr:methyltransferase domain-containing protein [Paludibaculum fermentans]QOY86866.1 methyltransferase domain-containing protein [Paludibaculum fermentans]
MDRSHVEHNERILSQFTLQAVPFAQAPSHSTEDSLRLLLETAQVQGSDEVLDIACGPGIVSCAFAGVAKWVVGMDLVPAMIEQARVLQDEKGLANVEWRLGDATQLPFPDNSFDLVVTRYSFHHLMDPRAVLREMLRVCRPGGRVVVNDVTPEPEKGAAYDAMETLRDPSHARAVPLPELLELGRQLGLAEIGLAFHRVDTSVEALLGASFPNPGDAEKLRTLIQGDVGVDRLSIQAYERDGELRFGFPCSMVAWRKPE